MKHELIIIVLRCPSTYMLIVDITGVSFPRFIWESDTFLYKFMWGKLRDGREGWGGMKGGTVGIFAKRKCYWLTEYISMFPVLLDSTSQINFCSENQLIARYKTWLIGNIIFFWRFYYLYNKITNNNNDLQDYTRTLSGSEKASWLRASSLQVSVVMDGMDIG